MISRKTTLRLQALYHTMFCENDEIVVGPYLQKETLYDFLYEEDFEGWFLDLYKRQVNTHADLRNFILNLHTGMAYTSRVQTLDDKKAVGQSVLAHLATSILKKLESFTPDPDNFPEEIGKQQLERQLELDGYIFKNGKLVPIESSVVDEQAEQSYLEDLIAASGLSDVTTIKHHLKLSDEHFVDGKWDDSISNSRKVLDAVLKQVAEAIYTAVKNSPPPPALLNNATDTRMSLEKQGIITTVERAALDKNYGLLSVTGGHPYIAQKDQARLMRHLALTFSQFVLLRYQGFLANNP